MKSSTRLLALALALAVVTAGCSSSESDGGSSSPKTTTTVVSTAKAAHAADEKQIKAEIKAVDTTDFCSGIEGVAGVLESVYHTADEVQPSADGKQPAADAALEAELPETVAKIDEVVPQELRADWETYASAANFPDAATTDESTTSTSTAAPAAPTAEQTAAADRIGGWVKENCKLTSDSGSDAPPTVDEATPETTTPGASESDDAVVTEEAAHVEQGDDVDDLLHALVAHPASNAVQPRLNPSQTSVKDAMNGDRRRQGLVVLTTQADAQAKAQAWANRLASEGRIYHSTLTDGIRTRWCGLGENVGYGSSASVIETAYMNSPGHRANILNKKWNGVGVGYATRGGTVYTVQFFIKTC